MAGTDTDLARQAWARDLFMHGYAIGVKAATDEMSGECDVTPDTPNAPVAEALAKLPVNTEIRRNEDGTLDEVVGIGHFHLERMSDDSWSLIVNGTVLSLWTSRGNPAGLHVTVVEAGPEVTDA